MTPTLYSTGNVKKFFESSYTDLPGNISGLVKTLDAGYQASAFAIVEQFGAKPSLVDPIINDMIGVHAGSVQRLVKGWNAPTNGTA